MQLLDLLYRRSVLKIMIANRRSSLAISLLIKMLRGTFFSLIDAIHESVLVVQKHSILVTDLLRYKCALIDFIILVA